MENSIRIITPEQHSKMVLNYCIKGKHKIRENHFGISFCTICGLISNKPNQSIGPNDQLLIK